MASIYARGKRLWGRLRDETGKWIGRKTKYSLCHKGRDAEQCVACKAERRNAERYIERAQLNINQRAAGELPAGELTVRAYALGDWLKARQVDDLDWKNDLGRLKHHVLPRIGTMMIADVRPKHLADLVRAWRTTTLETTGEVMAQRSVYNVWSVVSALFRDAAVAGLIDANPCREIGEKQLGPLTDKDPEWRAGAVFTRDEAEILISHLDIPFDRSLFYAFELLAGMRPGEIAARRWRDYDATVEPLGRLTIASALNTRKYKVKSTKTKTARIIPVHSTLGAMLAEWRLHGWEAMVGRAPTPDDLILPLPPDAAAARRSRKGEPFRTGDYAGKKWREVDLPMLKWRHRRMYDGKATMITLAIDDGADEDIIRTRVTHAKPVENAFDHYYRGTKWLRTCEELSKLRIARRSVGVVVALPDGAAAELATCLATAATNGSNRSEKSWRRRESNPRPKMHLLAHLRV